MEFWMGFFFFFALEISTKKTASNSRMYPDLCLLNMNPDILFHPLFQPTALTQTDWSDAKHRSLNSTNPLSSSSSAAAEATIPRRLNAHSDWIFNIRQIYHIYTIRLEYGVSVSAVRPPSRHCFSCQSLLFVLAETNSCTLSVESAPKKLFLHSIYIHSVKLRVWFVGEELSVNTASISLHEFQGASRQGLHQIPLMCLPNRFQRCSYWVKGCN